MPKRKGGLGPMWKGFDSYLTEEFKSAVNTGVDPREESLETPRQTAGSGDFAFTREREKDRQEAVAAGEEPTPGDYPPMINGADFNSTRVAGFRYVPHDPNDGDSGLGTLYVRFIKRGDEYQYDNVENGVYQMFAIDGSSKGKFINSTLNFYSYKRASDSLFFNW